MAAVSRVEVRALTVRADRVVCELAVTPPGAQSTPALMRALAPAFPHVGEHACVNDAGDRFADVMERTSLAHVLEHLVVDLQARAAGPGSVFVGTSEWADSARTRARVEVSFVDDLAALRAFKDATAALNEALAKTTR